MTRCSLYFSKHLKNNIYSSITSLIIQQPEKFSIHNEKAAITIMSIYRREWS